MLLIHVVLVPSEILRAQMLEGLDQAQSVFSMTKAQLNQATDSLEVRIETAVHALTAAEVVVESSPASESFIPPVRMDAVQLDQIPASSRIAAFAATAGVDMVSAGAGMLRPVLRGLSGLRIPPCSMVLGLKAKLGENTTEFTSPRRGLNASKSSEVQEHWPMDPMHTEAC